MSTDAAGPALPGSDRIVQLGPLRYYRVDAPMLRRTTQLTLGLVLFGVGLALGVAADLGVNPWTVLAEGLAEITGLSIGTLVILIGLCILATFPLYREPFGLGTVMNVLIIGPIVDLTLWALPDLTTMPIRILAIAAAPAVVGLASGLYIGAGLGPGPRDGMMTALERRGVRVSVARTGIEIVALAVGWVLGGTVGFGTVWMAGSIGVFVEFFLKRLRIDDQI